MAQVYWILNAPGFALEKSWWVELGSVLRIDKKLYITPTANVEDGVTVLEITFWKERGTKTSLRVSPGEIIDLVPFGSPVYLWPVAASLTRSGGIQKMLIGLSFNSKGGGNHELSTGSI